MARGKKRVFFVMQAKLCEKGDNVSNSSKLMYKELDHMKKKSVKFLFESNSLLFFMVVLIIGV